MDGQGDHLQSRAALRGSSLRRKAARGTIINGAFLVALTTCVAVAAVSYLTVERPFLKLRRRWGSTVATQVQAESAR